jgi:hypothetical protein
MRDTRRTGVDVDAEMISNFSLKFSVGPRQTNSGARFSHFFWKTVSAFDCISRLVRYKYTEWRSLRTKNGRNRERIGGERDVANLDISNVRSRHINQQKQHAERRKRISLCSEHATLSNYVRTTRRRLKMDTEKEKTHVRNELHLAKFSRENSAKRVG